MGIDVAKDWLDASLGGRVERFANDRAGLARLAAMLRAAGVTTVGMEPTGGYERLAVALLREAGFDLRMVDSWRLRQFAKGRGIRAKTDPLDARMIRDFLASHDTRPFPEPSQAQVRLTAWVREAARAEADIRRLRNRAEAVILPDIAARLEAEIEALTQTRAQADHAIAAILAEDHRLAARAELIASVPGLGPKTARVLLAELPELGSLSDRTAAALCGLAPYDRRSGKARRGAHIQAGRAALTRAGFLAARAMVFHNPWATALFKAMRAKAKPDKVAIIAIARRTGVILNPMLRNNTPWRQTASYQTP